MKIRSWIKANTSFVLLILLAGFATYFHTLSYPFHFDDKPNISENRTIADLGNFVDLEKAQRYQGKAEYPAMVKRYVGYLTFALNYAVHGLNVKGYRAVNLCIHLSNAVLVFWLVLVLFETPALRSSQPSSSIRLCALLAGLLFVVHPLQTQAITYVVQRLASLATLFYLISVVSYLKSRLSSESRKLRYGWFILSLAAAVAGMKTKETVFTLPMTAVLADACFFSCPWRQRLRWLVPLMLTMLIIPLTSLSLNEGAVGEAASIDEINMPRVLYLLTEVRVIVTYLRLWFLPINQSLIYDYPTYVSVLPVILSGGILACLLSVGFYWFKRSRAGRSSLAIMAFGIFWFFLTLMVESSIIPLYIIFEHRMYLPSVGLSLASAVGVMLMFQSIKQIKLLAHLKIIFFSVLVLLLCLTFVRNAVWKDEVVLWKDTVKKAPGSLMAVLSLANAYRSIHDHDSAINAYQKSLSMKPYKYRNKEANYHHSIAFELLGEMYRERNAPQTARLYYEKAIEADTDRMFTAYALNNLGTMHLLREDVDRAIGYYERAISKYPYYQAYFNLGSALIRRKRYEEAVQYLNEAVKMDASREDAYYNLGAAYFMSGKYETAIIAYQRVLSINPNHTKAAMNIARAYLLLKKAEEAVPYLEKVLMVNPSDREAKRLLSQARTSNLENPR